MYNYNNVFYNSLEELFKNGLIVAVRQANWGNGRKKWFADLDNDGNGYEIKATEGKELATKYNVKIELARK